MRSKQARRWGIAAITAWSVALSVVIARAWLLPHRATTLKTYEEGARHWLHGEPLYGGSFGGFIYSPLAAAFFALLLYFPAALRPVLWLAVNAGVFLSGVAAVLRAQLYPKLDSSYRGIVLLLLLPLVLGNFDVTQANPFVAGLLMLGLAAAWREDWNLAAVWLAVATYFKIYPVVVGLLMIIVVPRQLTWRLILALLVLGLLPFLTQAPQYVGEQYHFWVLTRAADSRFYYDIMIAPMDLWMLLVRLGGLEISPRLYQIIQVLSGLAIACYCGAGRRRGWSWRRMLIGLFSLACVWMTLCGPATEGLTYAILAPAVTFALLDAFAKRRAAWQQAIVCCSFALFLLAVAKNSLAPHLFGIWTRAMQPVAALIFLFYCLCWLLDGKQWPNAADKTPQNDTLS